jgi:4'-phosphopantetheinyl transferase
MNISECRLTVERIWPAQVNVWVTRLDQCHDGSLLRQYASLLSDHEIERWQSFIFERDRHAYLVSHALARTVLGRLVSLYPRDLIFDEECHGKPCLLQPVSSLGQVAFNLSHSDGMAILSTVVNGTVGVDVEYLGRPAPLQVAHQYFSPLEVRELEQCVPEDRPTRFWSLWTLKEAYIKATGDGLSAGLDRFSFGLDRHGSLEFTTSVEGPAEDSHLWFAQWLASPEHMAALCVKRADAVLPNVRFRAIVPLRSARDIQVSFLRCSAVGICSKQVGNPPRHS